jgi:hypothetical protein
MNFSTGNDTANNGSQLRAAESAARGEDEHIFEEESEEVSEVAKVDERLANTLNKV